MGQQRSICLPNSRRFIHPKIFSNGKSRFNEDLRCIDEASEIAFTYIDLLDHGQPGLANWFIDEVFGRNGD